MQKIIYVSLILFLIFSVSLEAKGKGGKAGLAKAIAKTVSKNIPKIKKMIHSSKRSKHLARKQIRKNVPKNLTGLYKFKASNNKPYLGKSKNVQQRLTQHINSGKLHPKDINTISFAKVAKKDVSEVEKAKIMRGDKITKGNLANKHHAPWSREKAKVLKESREKREQLLKTKF